MRCKSCKVYDAYVYAKVYSRITESSLMEEEIPVRYTFVMLLAISDPTGLVVGTNVALARRLNMPLEQFEKCIKALQQKDPDSNSKEMGGRRVVPSDGERGYQIVNFLKYRNIRDEEDRRRYMREYMRDYRSGGPVKPCKPKLTLLAQAEADGEAKAEEGKPPLDDKILWEGRMWFPSQLFKTLDLLQKELVGKEFEERKPLNAKISSLKVALGLKLPKCSKARVATLPKPERPPPTPEEGKKLADALRQAVDAV